MRIFYIVKYRDANPFKFGDTFLTFLANLVLQTEASILSKIEKNNNDACLRKKHHL